MNGFLGHLAYELRAGVRNPTQLLMSYLFPLVFYALMGAVMTRVNPAFTETLVPSMAVFCVLAGTVLGLPGPLVEGRTSGVHRGFWIHGVPAGAVVVAPALAAALHGCVAAAVVVLTGPPLFGGHAPAHPGWFALGLGVTALSTAALGALIGVVAGSSRSSVLLSQLVFLPSMMLGGLMIGLAVLPPSVRPFSGLLPTTYAMQALEALGGGNPTLVGGAAALWVLAAGGAASISLALFLFTWDARGGERRAPVYWAAGALLPYAVAGVALLR